MLARVGRRIDACARKHISPTATADRNIVKHAVARARLHSFFFSYSTALKGIEEVQEAGVGLQQTDVAGPVAFGGSQARGGRLLRDRLAKENARAELKGKERLGGGRAAWLT